MKRTWFTFVVLIFAGGAFFSLPYQQRQEIAKYIVMCLVLAFVLRPVGLTIGRILRKVLGKD